MGRQKDELAKLEDLYNLAHSIAVEAGAIK